MDLSVFIGMIGAVTSLSTGNIMEGGNPLGLLHITSFLIVVPTAIFSAVTSTESHLVKGALKEFKNRRNNIISANAFRFKML